MTPTAASPDRNPRYEASGTDSPMIVLDIGSTLVTGPEKGPASRIADRIGLDDRQKSALQTALMTIDFREPQEIADFMEREFGASGAVSYQAVSEVWAMQEDEAAPIPGAAEALAGLAQAGFRFAVVSNIWRPFLTAARKHFGDFFDEWIPVGHQLFSFREGTAKPNPDLFRRMLLATGTRADRTVMVGDSYDNDIAPATALGARTVWLLSRPAVEAAHLDLVMAGGTRRPSLALWSIADLNPTRVSTLFEANLNLADDTAIQMEEPR